MIEIKGLVKRYGSYTAVGGLDLQVGKGDICGFIGPNGAGKTTTLKILATLLRQDEGRVHVCGYDVESDAALVRRRIGYMPDSFGVYEDMTAREYLEFFAALYGIEPARARQVIGDVLELTDLKAKADAQVETLSRGVQQRLGLARVLVHDPDVLLLDEPASGLDPRARIEIRALLKELRAMGKTVLVSSHILSDLAEICNRDAIVERGKLLYQGDVASIIDRARQRGRVRVRVVEGERALDALRRDARIAKAEAASPIAVAVVSSDGRGVEIDVELAPQTGPDGHAHAFLGEMLSGAGVRILELREEEPDLEDAFMHVTRGEIS
ncbi:MAG TPA: ABC transporter ATP-binding protein [Planctomycetota bacterium]|nr:ABC transporter ATP-binding protein [Planctomycetota bacterium]